MLAVGLMSGTSLDGIDAVLCEIEGHGNDTHIKQLAFINEPMDGELKEKIGRCCKDEATTSLICSLNFEIGRVLGQAVLNVCAKAGVESRDLAFVASHGQTIWHQPEKTDELERSTLQIGEPAVIAQMCHCPVVSNFRPKDMAVNGEGAPLVPYSEYVLYRSDEYGIALQNIGGIGNVTVLPKNCFLEDVYAFDTGPGNMMIDAAMHYFFGRSYDRNGEVAASGKPVPELQEELKHHPYLSVQPPKSTGRELFGVPYTRSIIERYVHEKPEDIVCTLTWFTAYSIAESYRRFVLNEHPIQKLIVVGGGAYNKTLMRMLVEMLEGIEVKTQEDIGYSSDAKEAIAFVILGNETMHKSFSNVPGATGASQKVILGNITYPD